MWVKPRATSSQLQKNRSDIFRGWDSLNNGYTTLVGVAYLTGYDLRGQGYDALRERFSKYDIEVCSGFSTLFNYLSHLNNRHYQLVDQYFDGEVIVDSASLNAQMDVLMRQLEHYASYRSLFTFDGFANALTFGAHKSNAIEKAIDVLRNKLMKLCQYASATNSYYAKAREMTACLKRGIRLAGNLTYVEGRFVGNSRGYERWLSELHDIMAEIDKKIEDLKKHEKKYKGIVYTDMPGRYGGAQAGPLEIFNSK
ncbi:MAG: hypothetical protein LBK67_13400, partial [Coriobacteriales bacterium]|nr:hypothetical protein [Coriobacteriales bacterium]